MFKSWNKENPKTVFIFYFLVLSSKECLKTKTPHISVDLAPVYSDNVSFSALQLFLQGN